MKKGKYTTNVISHELHKAFIREFPEYKDMSFGEFRKNWEDIAEQIRYESVHNPLGVKLGSYIGELKLQYLPYDFKANHASEDGSPYLNLNMRSKVARLKWERRWAVRFNKILQFYAFDPVRKTEIMAKEYITNNPDKLRISRVTLGGRRIWKVKIRGK